MRFLVRIFLYFLFFRGGYFELGSGILVVFIGLRLCFVSEVLVGLLVYFFVFVSGCFFFFWRSWCFFLVKFSLFIFFDFL